MSDFELPTFDPATPYEGVYSKSTAAGASQYLPRPLTVGKGEKGIFICLSDTAISLPIHKTFALQKVLGAKLNHQYFACPKHLPLPDQTKGDCPICETRYNDGGKEKNLWSSATVIIPMLKIGTIKTDKFGNDQIVPDEYNGKQYQFQRSAALLSRGNNAENPGKQAMYTALRNAVGGDALGMLIVATRGAGEKDPGHGEWSADGIYALEMNDHLGNKFSKKRGNMARIPLPDGKEARIEMIKQFISANPDLFGGAAGVDAAMARMKYMDPAPFTNKDLPIFSANELRQMLNMPASGGHGTSGSTAGSAARNSNSRPSHTDDEEVPF